MINRVAEFRKRRRLNQTELGQLIGVSRMTISNIERGNTVPNLMIALQLARVLDVFVEKLFPPDENLSNEVRYPRR